MLRNRFLEALKRNLREKIEKQNLDVPQLCSCGPTIWDTNPDTCANNCIFYKNPKGMDGINLYNSSWFMIIGALLRVCAAYIELKCLFG